MLQVAICKYVFALPHTDSIPAFAFEHSSLHFLCLARNVMSLHKAFTALQGLCHDWLCVSAESFSWGDNAEDQVPPRGKILSAPVTSETERLASHVPDGAPHAEDALVQREKNIALNNRSVTKGCFSSCCSVTLHWLLSWMMHSCDQSSIIVSWLATGTHALVYPLY